MSQKRITTTMLDYFRPKRTTRSSSLSSSSSSSYPVIESNRKEFQFDTFHTSNLQSYPTALREIKEGEKTSHWIWYILPQLASLGSSHHAIWYGIKSFPEAQQYLKDDILGPRLIEISEEILHQLKKGIRVSTLMGSGIDASKLLSCVTLFYFVSYQTQYEGLFNTLRQLCEKKLKRQDRKTIQFCEVSMEKLHLEIPQYHLTNEKKNNNDDEKKIQEGKSVIQDDENQKKDENDENESDISSSQLSQPFSEIKSSSLSLLSRSTTTTSSTSYLDQLPDAPTHHPLFHLPSRSEFNFTPFYRSSNEIYHQALEEMKEGHKSSHWIWYILPQIESLGYSYQAKYYGIKSFEEASEYLKNKMLGPRLIEICSVILDKLQSGVDIDELMGSRVDALKLLSCSTLFYYVSYNLSSLNSGIDANQKESLTQGSDIDPNDSPSSETEGEGEVDQLSENIQVKYANIFQLFESLKRICEEKIKGKDHKTIEFCEDSMRNLNYTIPVTSAETFQQDDQKDNNETNENHEVSESNNNISMNDNDNDNDNTPIEDEEIQPSRAENENNNLNEENTQKEDIQNSVSSQNDEFDLNDDNDDDQVSVSSGSHEYNTLNDMELEPK